MNVQMQIARGEDDRSAVHLSPEFFANCLWKPSLVFHNLDSMETWPMSSGHGDGVPVSYAEQEDEQEQTKVFFVNYFKVRIGCSMSFRLYPFDKQV